MNFKFGLTLIFAGSLFAGLAWAISEKSNQPSDEAKTKALMLLNEEIKEFESILKIKSSKTKNADIQIRLSELYIERSQIKNMKGHEVNDPRLIKEAHQDLLASLGQLESLNQKNASLENRDRIFFLLGLHYKELGNPVKSIGFFKKILSEFPKSKDRTEAARFLADASFDAHEYNEAKKFYQIALKGASGPMSARTWFRLGWSYYKLRQIDEAIASMKSSVEAAKEQGETYVSLKDEILGDLARFYVDSGRFKEAKDYFFSITKNDEIFIDTLKKLAKAYENAGQVQLALRIYEALGNHENLTKEDQIYSMIEELRLASQSEDIHLENKFQNRFKEWLKLDSNRSAFQKISLEKTDFLLKRAAFLAKKNFLDLALNDFQIWITLTDSPHSKIKVQALIAIADLSLRKGLSDQADQALSECIDEALRAHLTKEASQCGLSRIQSLLKKGALNDQEIEAFEEKFRTIPEAQEEIQKYRLELDGDRLESSLAQERLLKFIKNNPKHSLAPLIAIRLVKYNVSKIQDEEKLKDYLENFSQINSKEIKDLLKTVDERLEFSRLKKKESMTLSVEESTQLGRDYFKLFEKTKTKEIRDKSFHNGLLCFAQAGLWGQVHQKIKNHLNVQEDLVFWIKKAFQSGAISTSFQLILLNETNQSLLKNPEIVHLGMMMAGDQKNKNWIQSHVNQVHCLQEGPLCFLVAKTILKSKLKLTNFNLINQISFIKALLQTQEQGLLEKMMKNKKFSSSLGVWGDLAQLELLNSKVKVETNPKKVLLKSKAFFQKSGLLSQKLQKKSLSTKGIDVDEAIVLTDILILSRSLYRFLAMKWPSEKVSFLNQALQLETILKKKIKLGELPVTSKAQQELGYAVTLPEQMIAQWSKIADQVCPNVGLSKSSIESIHCALKEGWTQSAYALLSGSSFLEEDHDSYLYLQLILGFFLGDVSRGYLALKEISKDPEKMNAALQWVGVR